MHLFPVEPAPIERGKSFRLIEFGMSNLIRHNREMVILPILALLVSPDETLPTRLQETAKQVVGCGVPETAVSVHAKKEHQVRTKYYEGRPVEVSVDHEPAVVIKGFDSRSRELLLCIARASMDKGGPVRFDGKTQQIYEELAFQVTSEPHRAAAEAWLRERGLLQALPRYDPFQGNAAEVADAVNKLCQSAPDGCLDNALIVSGMFVVGVTASPEQK